MDKSELKGIIWPTILTIILFSLFAFVVWPHTDMYKETKASQRLQAQAYLIKTYYDRSEHMQEVREFYLEAFKLTDDDINPDMLLEGMANAY